MKAQHQKKRMTSKQAQILSALRDIFNNHPSLSMAEHLSIAFDEHDIFSLSDGKAVHILQEYKALKELDMGIHVGREDYYIDEETEEEEY